VVVAQGKESRGRVWAKNRMSRARGRASVRGVRNGVGLLLPATHEGIRAVGKMVGTGKQQRPWSERRQMRGLKAQGTYEWA
jgi:hypothetical protein